jgi:hypothetical protein
MTRVFGSSPRKGGDFYLFHSTQATSRPDITMGIVNIKSEQVLNFNI